MPPSARNERVRCATAGRRHRAHQLHVDAGRDQARLPARPRTCSSEMRVSLPMITSGLRHSRAPVRLLLERDARRRCPGAARNPRRSRPRRRGRGCRRYRNTCGPTQAGRPRRRPAAAACFIISASRCGDAVAQFAAVADLVDRAVLDQELASAGSLPAASRARSARSRADRRSRSALPVRPMLMSPSIASDADTPPVVGCVITEM